MDVETTIEGMNSIVPSLSVTRKGELFEHNRDFSRAFRRVAHVSSLRTNMRERSEDDCFNGIMEGITGKDIRAGVNLLLNCSNLHWKSAREKNLGQALT